MTDREIKEPGNFLEFLGAETGNLLVSISQLRVEFEMFSRVDSLYRDAIGAGPLDDLDDLLIPQLLLFTHYQYWHSAATLLRCHLSDSLASTRTAIEAGLSAYRIIEDRSSQRQYVECHRSFLSHKRHFNEVWKRDADAYPLARHLLKRWDACSQYGSHADVDSFFHRLDLPDAESPVLRLHYFQHPRNRWEFGWYFLMLVHTFVIVLDVFEKYLVREKGLLPEDWAKSIRTVGKNVEDLMKEAKQRADSEEQ